MDAQAREHCRLDLHKVEDGAMRGIDFVGRWGRQLAEFLIDPGRDEDAADLREANKELVAAEKQVESLTFVITTAKDRLVDIAHGDDASRIIRDKLEAVIKPLEEAFDE